MDDHLRRRSEGHGQLSDLERKKIKEMHSISPSGLLLKLLIGHEPTDGIPAFTLLDTEQMGKGGVQFYKGKQKIFSTDGGNMQVSFWKAELGSDPYLGKRCTVTLSRRLEIL